MTANDTNHINLYEDHEWKHPTKVAGVPWKNPVGTASGTFQYAAVRWFYDVSQLGAVCTKGVSPVPWEGNPSPRTTEGPASNLNAVGLQNPGVDHYLVDDLPKLKKIGATVIANVAGHCDEDYCEVVAKLADCDADMLEINVSCPNVTHGGMSVGTDPVALSKLMDKLRPMTDKPMIVKLTPNVTNITDPARAAVEHGADALSMINTLLGMRLNIKTGEPIIANRTGGVSGPAVLPVGIAAVYRVRTALPEVPIIGIGGIDTGEKALEYLRSAPPPCSIRSLRCVWRASLTICLTIVRSLLPSSPPGRPGAKSPMGIWRQTDTYGMPTPAGCRGIFEFSIQKRERKAMAESLDIRFTQFLLESKALKFGEFTLKSGRKSPYFINAGAFNDGRKIATLGAFYAEKIATEIEAGNLPNDIDTVFGPAYKGIPLGVSTAIALTASHGMEVGYTFDRKEKKDHGDGGMMVGTQLTDGMKVLLVDDVMTAGTAVREVIPKLKAEADVEVVGLVLSVDRMEKTKDSDTSAVKAVEAEFGFPVFAIANVKEIFEAGQHIETADGAPYVTPQIAAAAEAYLAQYGA